jgi:hypothetical protein
MEYFVQGNLCFNLSTAPQGQPGANNTDKHHRRYLITYMSLFQYLFRAFFITLRTDQQMHNYLTNYHTPTCFDTIVSSSDSL